MRETNIEQEKDKIVDFIKNYFSQNNTQNGIIGLSGGIDSSVMAKLAVEALGEENILGVMLPYKTSSSSSLADAKLVAENFGITSFVRDISPMVDSYFDTYEKDASKLRRGNMMARVRMCVLYDLSAKQNALVIGTGNKTELLLGYVTQFGDGACALEPIGHLYKTEVRKLAKILEVPQKIIDKKPSADLWEGQTDEDELGITYRNADRILHYLIDKKLTIEEIAHKGIDKQKIIRIRKMVKNSEFKRRMPPSIDEFYNKKG